MHPDLEKTLAAQVVTARKILSNIREEQGAIRSKDIKLLDSVMDKRFRLLEEFEKERCQMVIAIEKLQHIEGLHKLTYEATLAALSDIISSDNIEIPFLISQLRALYTEILSQNQLSAKFLQDVASLKNEYLTRYAAGDNPFRLAAGVIRRPPGLQVIDEE